MTTINTNGGAYIAGNVNTGGGDFVARDKIVIVNDPEAIARAFAPLYERLAARTDLSQQDKAAVETNLREMERELAKGDSAGEGFLMERLHNIGRMSGDIFEVVVATLANPVAGLGLVAHKVAAKAREQ